MTVLIATEGLRVRYGARTVLDGVTVEIRAGDVLALTGRSGSGKTTLLLALAGLLPPSGGTVRIGDRRELAYVPQAPSLVPELTALENVLLAMRLRGTVPEVAEERARRELAALELTEAADALPHELSGGMAQRTALARALALDAAVLLVDEPTGSLDRATGARVLALLTARATGGTALVLATHDREVSDRLPRRLHLREGQLEEAA
ncbi:MAG TPA: ATP-binding cassette domain-containing protein [Sporichthya sp.]|nr:ATP-binding cassette domain-containing protein [Sporichthya sp.]